MCDPNLGEHCPSGSFAPDLCKPGTYALPSKPKECVLCPHGGNCSDGGAALVITSAKKARELKLNVLAVIAGTADAAHDAEMFTTAPALAVPIALKRAGVPIQDVDFFELNPMP